MKNRYQTSPTESEVEKITSSELDAGAEKSIIMASSGEINGEPYRWLSIFEKESPGLFDMLVGRPGFFKLTSLTSYQPPNRDSLQVEKIEVLDLDEDGTSEIHVRLHSLWADSTSTGPLIFKKNQDNNWELIALPSVKKTINMSIGNSMKSVLQPHSFFGMKDDRNEKPKPIEELKKMGISEELWEADHNGKVENFTTLRNGGDYIFRNHPIKGYQQVQITSFFSDDEPVLGPHYTVLTMLKIEHYALTVDDLWNWGHPMYSTRPLKLLDIDRDSISKAGIMAHIIDDVFYSYTEFEKIRVKP